MRQYFSVNKWRAVKQGWSPPSFWFTILRAGCAEVALSSGEIVPRAAELRCPPRHFSWINQLWKLETLLPPKPYLRFSENKSPWCGRGGGPTLINHLGLEDGLDSKVNFGRDLREHLPFPIPPPQQVKEPRPREERLLPQGHSTISCKWWEPQIPGSESLFFSFRKIRQEQ